MAELVEREQEEGLGQVLSGQGLGPAERSDATSDGRASRPRRGGPYLLFLPLAFTVMAVWWIRRPAVSIVPSSPPARLDPDSTYAVLGGETQLGGATLAFWLAPAEPSPERQVFQAKALQDRYGLANGEPWRLRLEWRALDAAQTAPPAAAPSSVQAPKLDVARLTIVDNAGIALAPLKLPRELDPLATLLSPAAQPLVIGTKLDLFLWGREPQAGVRLTGLADSAAEGAAAFEVNLTMRALRIGDLAGPMARLDPPVQSASTKSDGKRAGPGASALPVRGTDDTRY